MHLWNPDEPSTPRGSVASLSACLEERLREACGELAIPWAGCAGHTELLALCEHLGLEVRIKINRWPCFISLVCLSQFIKKSVNKKCTHTLSIIKNTPCSLLSAVTTEISTFMFQVNMDVLQSLTGDGVMNVQEFVSRVVNQNKPPTPSASTPYRQLKRHHSTQVRTCFFGAHVGKFTSFNTLFVCYSFRIVYQRSRI